MKPWLIAFAVTQLVEVPIYLRATGRKWLAAFGASLITHPVVWFLLPRFWPRGHWESLLIASALFCVAIEAAWLASWGVKRPIEWSLVANGASFAVTLVLQHKGLL